MKNEKGYSKIRLMHDTFYISSLSSGHFALTRQVDDAEQKQNNNKKCDPAKENTTAEGDETDMKAHGVVGLNEDQNVVS